MGTCASSLSKTIEADKGPLSKAGPLNAPVSRRYLQTNNDISKRNMADTITTAFVAHTAAEVVSNKGLKARLTSRQGAADARQTSAQTAQLGITASPTAESVPDLEPFQANATGGKSLLSCEQLMLPSDDSFEESRADTARKLTMLQKNFQSGNGNAAMAWAVLCSDPSQNSPKKTKSKIGRSGVGNDGGDALGSGGGAGPRSKISEGRLLDTAVEVVRADECMGDGRVTEEVDVVEAVSTTTTATGMATITTANELMPGGVEVEDMEEESWPPPRKTLSPSSRCQPVATLPGVPASRVSDDLTRSSTRPMGLSPTSAAAAASAMAAPPNAPIDPEGSETDEFRNLPLPNLISGGATSSNVRQGAAATQQQSAAASGKDGGCGHRYSDTSYAPASHMQSAGEEVARGPVMNATRNSDLGYYLEEARFTSTAAKPFHGAQPVRHSLLESAFAAQRVAAAAAAAEVPTRKVDVSTGGPVRLDYVPTMKTQTSRGSLLLAQQSTRRRLLPEPEEKDEQSETEAGSSAAGGGGGGYSGCLSSPGPQRLEYQASSRTISRKSSRGNPEAASFGGSPASPLHSSGPTARAVTSSSVAVVRHSTRSLLSSPRAANSERSLLHSRSAAANAAAQGPGSAPLNAATHLLRGNGGGSGGDVADPRVTTSASQVHFGAVNTFVLAPEPAVQSSINHRHDHHHHHHHLYHGGGGGVSNGGGVSGGGAHTGSPNAATSHRPGAPAPPAIGRWAEGAYEAANLPGITTALRGNKASGGGNGNSSGGGGGHDSARTAAAGDGDGGDTAVGSGSVRTAARAARLLATLHRLGVGPAGEQNPVAA